MSTDAIELRPLDVDDEAEVLSLLTTAMAGGPTGVRSSDYFDWKHRANPFGASPGLVAVHEDQIIGARLFLRWQLVQDGRRIAAVRAVDTATHPDYQRRGIFRRLTLTLLEQLELAHEVDLVFNTPNADSYSGYLRMGWSDVGTLPIRICPARPLAFLFGVRGATGANASGSASAVAPALETSALAPCDLPSAAELLAEGHAVTALLEQQHSDARIHTPLTLDYLRWRYGQPPGLDYRSIAVWHGNELVAIGFGRRRARAGLTELTVGDVVVRAGDRTATKTVLRLARRSGVHHVALHAASDTELAGQSLRSGYLRAPGRGIRLVANPRSTEVTEALAPASWRLSLGDLELF